MKNRILLVLLLLVCIGLGIGLVMTRKQAFDKQRDHVDRIGSLSNRVVRATADLEDQKNVNSELEKNLDQQKQAISDLSNSYTQVSTSLSQVNANLAKAEASLKAAEEEVKKREAKIADLEGQNGVLDKQASDLGSALTNLTVQIAETQRKLAVSEGDKALLEKELKRLTAEKAELERQFNDLAVLRAQVNRLREELSVARRIEWIRRSIFAGEVKGAQRLMQGFPATTPKPRPQAPDLNVEVSSDGGTRVVPPITNSPAPAVTTNAPAK